MSDTAEPPPAEPQVQRITVGKTLHFIKDNFVVVSAAAVVVGFALATMFLAAYLSVFDWHLLWFVQYTDILIFGILAVGVISGSLLFLQSTAISIFSFFRMDRRSQRWAAIVAGILIVGLIGFQMWGSFRHGEGSFHILLGVIVIALGVLVLVRVIGLLAMGLRPPIGQLFGLSLMVVVCTIYLGEWLGYSIRESANLVDVKLKDSSLTGVKLIAVMSRHTIVLKGDDIFVVPTADVVQFHATAGP